MAPSFGPRKVISKSYHFTEEGTRARRRRSPSGSVTAVGAVPVVVPAVDADDRAGALGERAEGARVELAVPAGLDRERSGQVDVRRHVVALDDRDAAREQL